MQRSMAELFQRYAFTARLGLTCLGYGPAALAKVESALAIEDPDWSSEIDNPAGFALTAPGPATSLLLAIWGLKQAGPSHAIAAVAGFLTPGTVLVVSILALLSGGAALMPHWTAGFTQGLAAAAVILFGQMLVQRAPQMISGSVSAVLALLAAAMVWLLPDATGQILALLGCALLALVLNLSPPEEVSFERHSMFSSSGPRWAAGSILAAVLILPWLLGDSALGWATSLIRASFLILQNETLLLAALDADISLNGESLSTVYGLVAGSGAPTAVLAAAAGFASAPAVWSGLILSLIAVVLIHGSTVFSMVFLWPRWQAWQRKNGRASILAGLQAGAFGILLPMSVSPLALVAVDGFTALVLIAAGVFALVRLQCPPWLLAGALGLISAMAAAI